MASTIPKGPPARPRIYRRGSDGRAGSGRGTRRRLQRLGAALVWYDEVASILWPGSPSTVPPWPRSTVPTSVSRSWWTDSAPRLRRPLILLGRGLRFFVFHRNRVGGLAGLRDSRRRHAREPSVGAPTSGSVRRTHRRGPVHRCGDSSRCRRCGKGPPSSEGDPSAACGRPGNGGSVAPVMIPHWIPPRVNRVRRVAEGSGG